MKTKLFGADALIRDMILALPEILHPNCAEGLTRLRLTARGSYDAIGYYYMVSGCKPVLYVMDGHLEHEERQGMIETILDSTKEVTESGVDCCGYFSLHPSDRPGCFNCCHYFISL